MFQGLDDPVGGGASWDLTSPGGLQHMLEVKLTANCGRYRQGKEVHAYEGRTLVQRFGSGAGASGEKK